MKTIDESSLEEALKKLLRALIVLAIILTLFGSICSAQRPDKLYRALEISYVGLQVADLATTINLINSGGSELNPIAKPFAHSEGLLVGYKVLTTGIMLYGNRAIYRDNPKLAKGTLIALNVIYGAIVFNNYVVTVRLKI